MTQAVFSYRVIDSQGKSAPAAFNVYVPDNTTLQVLHDAWVVLGTDVQTIVGGKVSLGRCDLTFAQDVNWRDVPLAGSFLANGGLFEFSITGSPYRQSFTVPALAADARDANSKIDITDAGVRAVINAMVTGFGAANAFYGLSHAGDKISGFLGCRDSGRGYSKQLAAKTFVSGSSYVP